MALSGRVYYIVPDVRTRTSGKRVPSWQLKDDRGKTLDVLRSTGDAMHKADEIEGAGGFRFSGRVSRRSAVRSRSESRRS